MELNILITGVGGQGTLLASRILGNYAMKSGLDCKLSEVHGMAQRGGSVVTYVRMGEKIYSPVIATGDADVLIAFEELEAKRFEKEIKKGGKIILNTQKIMPLPVIIGNAVYPQNIVEDLKKYDLTTLDALKIAAEIGNLKVVNTVMIGVLTKKLGLNFDVMLSAVENSVPEKVKFINAEAFKKSYSLF